MGWLGLAWRATVNGIAGALTGGLAAVAAISIATSAIAQSTPATRGVLDVTHSPTLLRAPDDPEGLVYEAHCAPAGVEDPEAECDVAGSVFVRAPGSGSFRQLQLVRSEDSGVRLEAQVPRSLLGEASFEYFAVVSSPDAKASVTVPAGGAAAPTVSRRLGRAVPVSLGRHPFAGARAPGKRVAKAPWGNGALEAGLEGGRTSGPIGTSSFDVDDAGAVVVLDHAHRKLLRWGPASLGPVRVPISVNGTIADIAMASDGSYYVLETTSREKRNPLVRRFDADGRELEAIETAERGPAQIRMGPDGPLVLSRPSHHWMPALISGAPASPGAQRRRGRDARTLPSGTEVVVQRVGNEVRLATLAGGSLTRSWRITSDTSLGEVQLAEPVGGRFVTVVRVYTESSDEFAVLLLDRRGLVSRTTVSPSEWAEGAPLGRFRLAGASLYRLGTSPAGVFVDRFDLEVS